MEHNLRGKMWTIHFALQDNLLSFLFSIQFDVGLCAVLPFINWLCGERNHKWRRENVVVLVKLGMKFAHVMVIGSTRHISIELQIVKTENNNNNNNKPVNVCEWATENKISFNGNRQNACFSMFTLSSSFYHFQ